MSVYFLRANTTPPTIKIGYSANVEARVKTILKQSPEGSAFLGYLPGARDLEAHFHYLFRRYRQHGEWFDESQDILDLIEGIAIKEMPGQEYRTAAHKMQHMDLKFAREAADALRTVIMTIGDGFRPEEVIPLLAPALGLSEARFMAIKNCEVDSVTAAEYTQILLGLELSPLALDGLRPVPASQEITE